MIDVKASGDLDALTEHVLSSAKEKAKATIERAQARAGEIAEEAKERSRRRKQELVRSGQIGIDQARKQIISQAKLRLKEDLLATKAKIIEGVITKVREHLELMRDNDETAYLDLLVKLVERSTLGKKADPYVLYLSPADASRYAEEVKRLLSGKLGSDIEIKPGKEMSGGVIVELPDEHVQIDISFAELLREAIPAIERIVDEQIFLSGDVDEEKTDER